MPSDFYTYFHTRNDTNAVFYVGKGRRNRSHTQSGRSIYWRRVVLKHGYTVHIAAKWALERDALRHEEFLIKCFKDLGVSLVNLTDGGEGVSGFRHSADAREKIAKANTGKRLSDAAKLKLHKFKSGRFVSDETKARIGAASSRRAGTYSHTAETKAKISESNVKRNILFPRRASAETKTKISAAAIEAHAKRKMEETLGIRTPNIPVKRILSEETKDRMRTAQLARWAKKRGEISSTAERSPVLSGVDSVGELDGRRR